MGSTNMLHCLAIIVVIGNALLSFGNVVTAQLSFSLCAGEGIISFECGKALGDRIAKNVDIKISNECCAEALLAGKPCHNAFTKHHLMKHDYVGTPADVIKRSDEVWNYCVNSVEILPAEGPDPLVYDYY